MTLSLPQMLLTTTALFMGGGLNCGCGHTDPGCVIPAPDRSGTYLLRAVNNEPLPSVISQTTSERQEVTGGTLGLSLSVYRSTIQTRVITGSDTATRSDTTMGSYAVAGDANSINFFLGSAHVAHATLEGHRDYTVLTWISLPSGRVYTYYSQ